jgi:hypothetical protein
MCGRTLRTSAARERDVTTRFGPAEPVAANGFEAMLDQPRSMVASFSALRGKLERRRTGWYKESPKPISD